MDIVKSKTVAFTGHRDINGQDDIFELLKTHIKEAIANGYDTFLTGMAKGFDLLAGEAVIYLKEKYPNIKLVACVPYKAKYFPGFSYEDSLIFDDVLSRCDEILYSSENYAPRIFLKRDRFMIDNCSFVIAYLERQKSGTGYTVDYAKSLGIKVVNIKK